MSAGFFDFIPAVREELRPYSWTDHSLEVLLVEHAKAIRRHGDDDELKVVAHMRRAIKRQRARDVTEMSEALQRRADAVEARVNRLLDASQGDPSAALRSAAAEIEDAEHLIALLRRQCDALLVETMPRALRKTAERAAEVVERAIRMKRQQAAQRDTRQLIRDWANQHHAKYSSIESMVADAAKHVSKAGTTAKRYLYEWNAESKAFPRH